VLAVCIPRQSAFFEVCSAPAVKTRRRPARSPGEWPLYSGTRPWLITWRPLATGSIMEVWHRAGFGQQKRTFESRFQFHAGSIALRRFMVDVLIKATGMKVSPSQFSSPGRDGHEGLDRPTHSTFLSHNWNCRGAPAPAFPGIPVCPQKPRPRFAGH
jgi:hypothetical protein